MLFITLTKLKVYQYNSGTIWFSLRNLPNAYYYYFICSQIRKWDLSHLQISKWEGKVIAQKLSFFIPLFLGTISAPQLYSFPIFSHLAAFLLHTSSIKWEMLLLILCTLQREEIFTSRSWLSRASNDSCFFMGRIPFIRTTYLSRWHNGWGWGPLNCHITIESYFSKGLQ